MTVEARAPSPTTRERALGEPAVVVGGFLALTLLMTFPQVCRMRDGLGSHYDALFSVWRLAWIAHALRTNPGHLFDANIFAPAAGTLAYSDAMLLPGLLATPLIWAGIDPVVVHNGLVLLSFVACGSTMYLLVRTLTFSAAAAFLAGVIFAFSPFRIGHYPQLELLWSWPVPLAFWALHRITRDGSPRWGFWLAMAVALQLYASIYFGVFLVLALAILALPLVLRGEAQLGAQGRALGIACGVCAMVTLPYLWVYAQSGVAVGTRTLADVQTWSPTIARFVETSPDNWLYGRPLIDGSLEMYLFPGLTALLLAVAGVCLGPRALVHSRLAYALLLIVAIDLTRGANGLLYAFAYDYLWPLRGLRVPARMNVIVSAVLAVLAGLGLQQVLNAISGTTARRVIGTGVTLGALLEYASVPLTLSAVPVPVSGVYNWLQQQPPTTILEWPVPNPAALGATHDPLYMFYSTRHWHRLVNGYSGFAPGQYILLLEAMQTFPTRESLAALRAVNVEFVVLHGELEPDRYRTVRDGLMNFDSGVELVAGEHTPEGERSVFRIASRHVTK